MLSENEVLIAIVLWCGRSPWVQKAFNHSMAGDGENGKPERYTPGTADSISAPAKSKHAMMIQTAVII